MLFLINEPKTLKTVNDLYIANKDSNTPLLTDYSAEWWKEYVDNYAIYDAQFNRMFKHMYYFNQDYDDIVSEVLADFKSAVKGHLLLNSKKYAELYRVQTIDDDIYSIVDNYSLTETMDKDTTGSDNEQLGSRSDSSTTNKGTEEYSISNQKAPYDEENYYNDNKSTYNMGAREDTDSFEKGEQTNTKQSTGTEDYTLKRVGNIGVKTVTEMLNEHTKFWLNQEFLPYIFTQIYKDLLLV